MTAGFESWLHHKLCDLGKSLNPPEPQFPHLRSGGDTYLPPRVTVRIYRDTHKEHLTVPCQAQSGVE